MSLGGFGDALSSAISAYSNHREAEQNRDWQELQRATAYQTTVQDLQAAGLSPMLAYSKGPTSGGSGATAAPMQPLKLGETEQRETSSDVNRAQVDVAKSQEQLNIQSAKKTAMDAQKTAIEVEQMPQRFYYDLAVLGSQIDSNSAGAVEKRSAARNTDQRTNIELPNEKASESWWKKNISPYLPDASRIISSAAEGVRSVRPGVTINKHYGSK